MSDVRLILEPSVYVLARPALDHGELRRFLADTGFPGWRTEGVIDAQVLTEVAARVCYRSFGRGRPHKEHIAHLRAVGHLSTFEHAQWTLLIIGVSRSLTHELVRHRHLSYSQESQRYVDASDVAFVVPPAVLEAQRHRRAVADEDDPGFADWADACRAALAAYRGQTGRLSSLSHKQAREAARAVLPGCCETRLAVSGNARAWREVFAKRDSPAADAEIRRLAEVVRRVLSREAPDLFAAGEG